MHFVLAGGGTAGHIHPAVAMAQLLKEAYPSATFTFLGRKSSMEETIIREKGYAFLPVEIEGLKRKSVLKNISVLKKARKAVRTVKTELQKNPPDIVFGTGGYVSYPLIKAASELNIPAVLHESNSVPGLSVKISAKAATCVLTQFEETATALSRFCPSFCVGALLMKEVHEQNQMTCKANLGIPGEDFLVVSFGGSQGAEAVNEACLSFMKNRLPAYPSLRWIHASGEKHYSALRSQYPDLPENAVLLPYIRNMGLYMNAADLLVTRSGALTLGEISALGKPSLLIPSPFVPGNHQYRNARVYQKNGAAFLLQEEDLSPASLEEKIVFLRQNPSLLRRMGRAAKAMTNKNTKELFLSYTEHILQGKPFSAKK
ncbi:MAG: UDP-N-acetylglucosamine--N-acetylmuramyl-(pentapeptide) pyrophosphoryl-undecaprenol N-acetylglucosamine transferase [Clostridia bacterium]|nr:UDP-N-acetylglucosamine--N-acetylmuramyl-(pentapeptide) pyrophosphoryl-undecaprenol N-acetylglucosamine transferase [Clostridia bacterium]